jgi:exodeoxyribonuclease VIII
MNENELYHSDVSRVSNSMMTLLKESPRKFYNRYELGRMEKPTEAMLYGSLTHCLTFEPDAVDSRFAVAPHVDGRTKEGKAIKAEFHKSVGDRSVVNQDMFRDAVSASVWARRHPEFRWFADNPAHGIVEERIEFEFHDTLCKCKPDYLCLDNGIIWDLKTTNEAAPGSFSKSIASYGYHRQAAFYREAVRQKHGVECRFLFLVVAKTDPWESAVYELDEAAMQQGMQEIYFLLDELAARKAANDWEQVWGSGVVPLTLPRWYTSNIYEFEEVLG